MSYDKQSRTEIEDRLAAIRLLSLDTDGVLTDGGIYFNDAGELVEDIRWWRAFLKQWYGSVERILDWCAHGVQDHGIATYERRFDDLFRRMGWAIPATLDSNGAAIGRSQVRRRLIDPRRRAA